MLDAEKSPPIAAYCDVDGTLTTTNSAAPLLWYRRRRGTLADRVWRASLLLRGPWWMLLYRWNNASGNRAIYRQYRGFDATQTRADAAAFFEEFLKPRLQSQVIARVRGLKEKGARIVLVTGGLEFIMRPLAEYFGAELIAPDLVEDRGVFTGEMTRPPLTGSAKYVAVCKHALRNGIDLTASYAFGNEYGDANMLYAVGHPVAVCPDRRLREIALREDWEIMNRYR